MIFEFRLESEDGKEHRSGTCWAESEEEAKAFLEAQEEKFVAFQLGDTVAEPRRAHHLLAAQTKPYKLKYLRKA